MSDGETKKLQIHVPDNPNNDRNEISIGDLNKQCSVLSIDSPACKSEINDIKDADLKNSKESGQVLKTPSELFDGKSTKEMFPTAAYLVRIYFKYL